MADRIAVMRAGSILQVGRPDEVYARPSLAFVVTLFGQVNEVRGVVRDAMVATPLGAVRAAGQAEGVPAVVLIRPEGLMLSPVGADEGAGQGPPGCPAKVLASRLLGRTSWIHLCLGDLGAGEARHLHMHARVPGRYLPAEGELLEVRLDPAQVFVFAG